MDSLTEPTIFLSVSEEDAGGRLDVFLADRVRECSRTFLQRMIRDGNVTINGGPSKPSVILKPGDEITAIVVEEEPEDLTPFAEPIPLDIIWEDADIIVVNKPPGMISHASFGHTSGTLVNAVLNHAKQLSDCGGLIRPGIVHRLDLDTSGVIIVARNNRAHRRLQNQFRAREVHKEYRAIAHGRPEPRAGTISAGIARHARDHKRMRTSRDGKEASTDYRTLERFKRFSYIALRPHSGRTHQIRVHLRSRGHPILCDGLYGRGVQADRCYLLNGRREPGAEPIISRQALHAARISFRHPSTNQVVGYEAPIPADMQRALDILVAGG